MKCISLWQPWASLFASGRKRVETRGWQTGYRGPLLVHAAKKWDDELSSLCDREPFASALRAIGAVADLGTGPADVGPLAGFVKSHTRLTLPFGAIVGRVELVECYPTELVAITAESANDPEPQRYRAGGDEALGICRTEFAFGDYRGDRFAWLCTNAVLFPTPIPHRGHLQLFDVPDAALAAAGVAP